MPFRLPQFSSTATDPSRRWLWLCLLTGLLALVLAGWAMAQGAASSAEPTGYGLRPVGDAAPAAPRPLLAPSHYPLIDASHALFA